MCHWGRFHELKGHEGRGDWGACFTPSLSLGIPRVMCRCCFHIHQILEGKPPSLVATRTAAIVTFWHNSVQLSLDLYCGVLPQRCAATSCSPRAPRSSSVACTVTLYYHNSLLPCTNGYMRSCWSGRIPSLLYSWILMWSIVSCSPLMVTAIVESAAHKHASRSNCVTVLGLDGFCSLLNIIIIVRGRGYKGTLRVRLLLRLYLRATMR